MTSGNGYERSECSKVADQMLDYIYTCAKHGVVPLVHDANVFRSRLEGERILADGNFDRIKRRLMDGGMSAHQALREMGIDEFG